MDTDAARAARVAGELGCAHVTDYRELLPRIDAACVAVPTGKHYEVARACLEAGVHVLVEKPLSRTLAEADALLELARAKSLVLQVGHLQRFNPAFQALAAARGRPLFIDIERLAPFKDARHRRRRGARPDDPRPRPGADARARADRAGQRLRLSRC